MNNLRFLPLPSGQVEIQAKLKATGKFGALGFCHPATVPLIKKDGIRAHISLVRIP